MHLLVQIDVAQLTLNCIISLYQGSKPTGI